MAKFLGIKFDKNKLKNLVKHEPKKKDVRVNPNRDWRILIYTLFILLIVSAYMNYYFYKRAEKMVEVQTVETINQQVNIRQLEDVVNLFDAKSVEFSKYTSGEIFVEDPSN